MPDGFHLFEVFGVELEYMIVDRATLRVRPVSDLLLTAAAGQPGARAEFEDGSSVPTEVSLGPVSWSNELVAHVIEFKTAEPSRSLAELPPLFQASVARANALLAPLNAVLLPTAMHPTMNPDAEMRLWAHGYSEVYAAFDRIFDCRGHGWANLQAAHLNLPFRGDDEFGRLHLALRALVPIMPALAASSPVMDGRPTGVMDNRMEVYRANARRVPSVAGLVVPEAIATESEYRSQILRRIYDDMAPLDPEGTLRDEWCNSRGVIARFSRGSLEVRVLDIQEHPGADVAIAAAIAAVARAITEGSLGSARLIGSLSTERLHGLLLRVTRDAEAAAIDDGDYLAALGAPPLANAGELWRWLVERVSEQGASLEPFRDAIDVVLRRGTLARRIARALGPSPTPDAVTAAYRALSACLAEGRAFGA